MNSFMGIFQGFYLDFMSTVLSPLHALPMYYLKPPSNFEEPPMLSTLVGKPAVAVFSACVA